MIKSRLKTISLDGRFKSFINYFNEIAAAFSFWILIDLIFIFRNKIIYIVFVNIFSLSIFILLVVIFRIISACWLKKGIIVNFVVFYFKINVHKLQEKLIINT